MVRDGVGRDEVIGVTIRPTLGAIRGCGATGAAAGVVAGDDAAGDDVTCDGANRGAASGWVTYGLMIPPATANGGLLGIAVGLGAANCVCEAAAVGAPLGAVAGVLLGALLTVLFGTAAGEIVIGCTPAGGVADQFVRGCPKRVGLIAGGGATFGVVVLGGIVGAAGSRRGAACVSYDAVTERPSPSRICVGIGVPSGTELGASRSGAEAGVMTGGATCAGASVGWFAARGIEVCSGVGSAGVAAPAIVAVDAAAFGPAGVSSTPGCSIDCCIT